MGKHERQPSSGIEEQPGTEILRPRHFYAAYVFDQANEREQDIVTLIQQAQQFGYPLRYWWLSDAMALRGSPNRLILCVHHPSSSEDAGMDLYDTLRGKGTTWDDLEAAAVDEYRYLGAPVEGLGDLRSPHGNLLFPHANPEAKHPVHGETILVITQEDVRDAIQDRLGRDLTDNEFSATLAKFKDALDWMDWTFYLEEALRICQEAGQVGPGTEETFLDAKGKN